MTGRVELVFEVMIVGHFSHHVHVDVWMRLPLCVFRGNHDIMGAIILLACAQTVTQVPLTAERRIPPGHAWGECKGKITRIRLSGAAL